MNEKEIVQVFAAAVLGMWLGYVIAGKHAAADRAQAVQSGQADGTGAFAMSWFTEWGKGGAL